MPLGKIRKRGRECNVPFSVAIATLLIDASEANMQLAEDMGEMPRPEKSASVDMGIVFDP